MVVSPTAPDSDLATRAALLTEEFRDLYLRWGAAQPPRTGLHASSLLASESDWCTRFHVLTNLYPEQLQPRQLRGWEWKQQATFLDGWERHRKLQFLLRAYGENALRVVYQERNVTISGTDQHGNAVSSTVLVNEPETDLTHYDETRQVYFSPDAIVDYAGTRYVCEFKGLDTAKYEKLTDDLDAACQVSDVIAKGRVQCLLYMHLLGLEYGLLLIEDKNTQQFRCYVLHKQRDDRAAVQPQVDRLYAVKKYTTLKKLPERACLDAACAKAARCPMRAVCFQEQQEEGEERYVE